jgi:hypothetical protein
MNQALLPPCREDLPGRPRLAADVYLDLRHPGLFWFEHLGLIRAEREWVEVAPGALDILLALAGRGQSVGLGTGPGTP